LKQIETLIQDIENLFEEGLREGDYSEFGRQSSEVLQRGLRPRDGQRPQRVWFSNVGGPCTRKLWYKINASDKAEPFLPHTRLKFLYGDLLEGLLLDLAQKAGHTVEYEQAQVEWNEITGRIDAVIDGVLVDVKSASSFSFKKFQGGLQSEDDAFGYLGQIAGYLLAGIEAGWCEPKRAAFLVINKETGKLCLDTHEFNDDDLSAFSERIKGNKKVAEGTETPEKAFAPVPEGKSGNLKLAINCSYCEFNKHCWPEMRTFLYSNKPIHLVHVEREPNVPELKEESKKSNE
jgi:hypothetical protein